MGCRFPRWLSSAAAAHWHSLDTVAAPDHSAASPLQARSVSRVALSVSPANASFINLDVFGGGSNDGRSSAPGQRRQLYFAAADEEESTVLCHKREKMTTVGERVVRLILYQTKGW